MTAASVEPILPWMRIAEVAPLHESVPPRQYGGTERVVSYLTEELVARGHDGSLLRMGGSHQRERSGPALGTRCMNASQDS